MLFALHNALFAMPPALFILFLSLDPHLEDMDAQPRGDRLELRWHDAEEDLRGALTPSRLRANSPIHVGLRIEPFSGAKNLVNAASVTLRPVPFAQRQALQPVSPGNIDHEDPGTVVALTQQADGSFAADIMPTNPGPHVLQVSFHSTRLKIARTALVVESAALPTWPWIVLATTLLFFTLFFGIRSQLK